MIGIGQTVGTRLRQASAGVRSMCSLLPPDAPSGLSITDISTTTMTLNWSAAPVGITGIKVYKRTPAGSGPYTLAATIASNLTSYQFTILAVFTEFDLAVAFVSDGGESTKAAATATTLFDPSAIANLSLFLWSSNGYWYTNNPPTTPAVAGDAVETLDGQFGTTIDGVQTTLGLRPTATENGLQLNATDQLMPFASAVQNNAWSAYVYGYYEDGKIFIPLGNNSTGASFGAFLNQTFVANDEGNFTQGENVPQGNVLIRGSRDNVSDDLSIHCTGSDANSLTTTNPTTFNNIGDSTPIDPSVHNDSLNNRYYLTMFVARQIVDGSAEDINIQRWAAANVCYASAPSSTSIQFDFVPPIYITPSSLDGQWSTDGVTWTTVNGIDSRWVLTGRTANTLYYMRARYTISGVASDWSVAKTCVTLPAAPVIDSVVGTPGSTTTTTTTFHATGGTALSQTFQGYVDDVLIGNVTSPWVYTPGDAGGHTYTVKSTTTAGQSAASNAVVGIVLPAAPVLTSFTASGQALTSVFDPSTAPSATSYRAYYSTTNPPTTADAWGSALSSPIVTGGFAAGTTYYSAVLTVDSLGQFGPLSNVMSATTDP